MNVNDMSKLLNIINDVFQEKKAELRRLGVDDWILDRVFKIFTYMNQQKHIKALQKRKKCKAGYILSNLVV